MDTKINENIMYNANDRVFRCLHLLSKRGALFIVSFQSSKEAKSWKDNLSPPPPVAGNEHRGSCGGFVR